MEAPRHASSPTCNLPVMHPPKPIIHRTPLHPLESPTSLPSPSPPYVHEVSNTFSDFRSPWQTPASWHWARACSSWYAIHLHIMQSVDVVWIIGIAGTPSPSCDTGRGGSTQLPVPQHLFSTLARGKEEGMQPWYPPQCFSRRTVPSQPRSTPPPAPFLQPCEEGPRREPVIEVGKQVLPSGVGRSRGLEQRAEGRHMRQAMQLRPEVAEEAEGGVRGVSWAGQLPPYGFHMASGSGLSSPPSCAATNPHFNSHTHPSFQPFTRYCCCSSLCNSRVGYNTPHFNQTAHLISCSCCLYGSSDGESGRL